MEKINKSKVLILILLFIILILLNVLFKENIKSTELIKSTEITENTILNEKESNSEIIEIKSEKKEVNLIINKFIKYNYHPRLLQLGLNKLKFNSSFFKIEVVKSDIDYDNDGIDDYTDILNGAHEYIETNPIYKSEYYEGGYPPKEIGVCTDVIWNSLNSAGYNLKELVDKDIKNNTNLYPATEGKPDPNIDFRRVRNLEVYFSRNVKILTTDTSKIEEWQPGDIIVYSFGHIGIVSNIRNYKGVPYLIHHGGRVPAGEYNTLESEYISGHFRIKFN